jgi:ABC-type glycerol-3-phosphate transport system substrate-binding protein
MLEFAAHFPETVPDDGEYVSDTTRIAEGKQMLMSAGIYDIDDSFYNNSYFGGSITYIGYPTNEGVGNVLNLTNNYGMSSSCKNKEAAWQFLRGLLTMDSQRFYGLPTNKNLFEQKMKAAMTPEYEEDESGNIRLDENGEKIMIPRSTWRDELGNEVVYYALTEEDAAKLREAIVAADRWYTQDTGLVEIVQEMTKAYFAGQKSAEEVARLVQSKVSIYVNEHR